MHHGEAVAEAQGVLHVVRDHECREAALCHDVLRDRENLLRRLGVECRRVLIEKQELRRGHRRHEQRQGLTLAAGQQADLGFEPVFKPEVQPRQKFFELRALRLGNAPAQPRRIAAARGDGEVFLNHHARRRAHHGVYCRI